MLATVWLVSFVSRILSKHMKIRAASLGIDMNEEWYVLVGQVVVLIDAVWEQGAE